MPLLENKKPMDGQKFTLYMDLSSVEAIPERQGHKCSLHLLAFPPSLEVRRC